MQNSTTKYTVLRPTSHIRLASLEKDGSTRLYMHFRTDNCAAALLGGL
jgi:hypothetical protein